MEVKFKMGVHYGPRPSGNLPPIVTPPAANPASGNIMPYSNTTWTRPADWITMPNVQATDQVFYGIYAVWNQPANFATFRATGAYTINWGDGTIENYASNVVAYHNYNYSSLSAGTTTSRGYRQALITVTPQSGQTISAINLNYQYNSGGVVSRSYHATGWLDIRFAMNNSGTFFQYNAVWRHYMLERVDWVATSASQTSGSELFRGCASLQSVPNVPFAPTTCFAMFFDCYSIQEIPLFNTANATACHYMFYQCRRLQEIPAFNFGNSTDFSLMFRYCYRLKYVPPLDTTKALYMQYMFEECYNLELLGQTTLNTSNVIRAEYMFNNCFRLRFLPTMDTSKITRMDGMFYNNRSLLEMPQIDTSSNTNFYRTMGYNCSLKYTRFIGTTNLGTRFDEMFIGCYVLEYVPALDTSSATLTNNMFNSCLVLQRLTQSSFDLSNCTSAAGMFANCNLLKVSPVLLNSSKLTNINNMFTSCFYLSEIGYFDTSAVTDFYRLFINCYNLESIDWAIDCRRATRVQGMFYSCISLKKSPRLDNINLVNSCTDFHSLYYNCTSLQDFTNTELDTSRATSLYMMFYNCRRLQTIPFHLDTSSATDMRMMFRACSALLTFNQINDEFVTTSLRNYDGMFWDCWTIRRVPNVEIFAFTDTQNISLQYMFYNCYNLEEIPANIFNKVYLDSFGNPRRFIMNYFATNCWSLTTVPAMSFGQVYTIIQAFQSCRNIEAFPTMDTSLVTDIRNLFAYCYSMQELPAGINFALVTNADQFCISATALINVPDLGATPNLTYSRYMFWDCYRLRSVEWQPDTSKVFNAARMYGYSRSLKSLPGTYNFQAITSESTSATEACSQFILDCNSLTEVTIINCRRNLYFQNLSVSTAEIVKMFNALGDLNIPEVYPITDPVTGQPTTESRATARTIYISGSLGTAGLTAANRLIATNKNWIISG